MAEKVEIEIPGIGLIEAKNAATEATLNEILRVLQGTQKDINKSSKNKGGDNKGGQTGDGGKSLAGMNQAASNASKRLNTMAQAGELAGKSVRLMGYAAGSAAGAVSGLAAAGGAAAGAVLALGKNVLAVGESMTEMISRLAQVGDSTTSAANALRMIPGVGGILANTFGAVAAASETVVGAYQKAASVGATFGGSVDAMSRAAGGAGMTLDKFAGLLQQNGESLMMLGGTTEAGARQFSILAKNIQNSQVGSELQRLGFTTEQINGGMARYIGILGKTGALQGMSTQQIVASSGAYLKELDALAKITGVSREEKEKEQQALMRDAKVRAAMAGLDADQQRQMMAYITSFPKEQQGAIADMIATGNVTTEDSIKLQSMLPGVAQRTMEFGRVLQAGGKITQDQLNASKNAAILEAKDSVKRNKARGMYDEEAGKQYVAMADLAAQQVNGYSKAIGEQGKATAQANLAENLTKAKQRLAEFSNNFQMALANSGMLDSLMQAFQTLATFTMEVIVPLFNIFAQAINAMMPVITGMLIPALKTLGQFVQDYVVPGFMILGDWIITAVVPIFKEAYNIVSTVVGSLFDFFDVSSTATDGLGIFEEILYTVSDFIEDNLQEVLIGFGIIMGTVLVAKVMAFGAAMLTTLAPIGSFIMGLASATFNILKMAAQVAISTAGFLLMNPPILAVIAAVGLLVYGFKKMGGDLTILTDAFKWAASWASTLFLKLQLGIYSLLNKIPGMRGDFDKDIKGISQQLSDNEKERSKLETDMAERRKANLDAAKTAELNKIEEAKKAEAKAKEDEARKEEQQQSKEERRAEAREERRQKRERDAIARREKRERDAIQKKEGAELSAIDRKEEREREAAEAKDVKVDMADPIQMLKSFAAQQKSAFTQEAKALDDKERAQSELKMASEEYAKAVSEQGKATNDLERKAAADRVAEASKRLASASKANEEADKAVTEAAKRMTLAKQGKDPGATAMGTPPTTQTGTTPSATATPQLDTGPIAQGMGVMSGNLYQQTQDAINKGVKYGFGSKNLASGAIDCSGWISTINTQMIDSINKEAGKEVYGKEAKRAFKDSAAGIIKNVSDLGGGMIEGSKNIRSQLKEGMLIGEDNGEKGWDAGRYKGIDHITQAVKDPKTGKLMISESQGGKGVTLTDPEEYFKKKEAKGVKLYGTDMTKLAKGEGNVTAPPVATGNLPTPEARRETTANAPRTEQRAESRPSAMPEPRRDEPIGASMQSLVRDGIVPTTIAFQDLVKKGIMPLFTGNKVRGEVPVNESLAPGESIVKTNPANLIENRSTLSSSTNVDISSVSKQAQLKNLSSSLNTFETPKTEIIAQAEKEAKEKAEAMTKQMESMKAATTGPSMTSDQNSSNMNSSDLNTALAELIAISKRTAELNEQQLSVQSSLSGNLYT